MEELTLAVNRLDQILDNEKKLELKLTELKKQVEKHQEKVWVDQH